MILIGLHGYQGTGKDTVARILSQDGYQRVSFADPMRAAMLKLNPLVCGDNDLHDLWTLQDLVDEKGWDTAKREYPEVRRLLQKFGTECGRDLFGEDCWVNLAMREAVKYRKVVFTDVRFPNEAAAIKRRGGFLIEVTRPGHGPREAHASEQSLAHLCDRHIDNSGDLEHLRVQVGLAFIGAGYILA